MGYFGGLGLEIETHRGLADVGLPDGVGGTSVVVNEILPLVVGGAGGSVKFSSDVGRLDGVEVDSSGEIEACEGSGQSRLGGDSPNRRVRGRQHAGKRGLQRGLRVGGAERHEGDEKRQELRGCGRGREGRGR